MLILCLLKEKCLFQGWIQRLGMEGVDDTEFALKRLSAKSTELNMHVSIAVSFASTLRWIFVLIREVLVYSVLVVVFLTDVGVKWRAGVRSEHGPTGLRTTRVSVKTTLQTCDLYFKGLGCHRW
jgi:hypothetical protein